MSVSDTIYDFIKFEAIYLYSTTGLVIFFGLFPNVILHVSEEPVKQLIEQVHNATIMVK